MTPQVKLKSVKLLHSLVWLCFNVIIFYSLYAVVADKLDVKLWLCLAAVFIESVVLLMFGWKCPLTVVARKYSNSTEPNFDIYLPKSFARYNKEIYSVVMLLIVAILIYRLLT